MRASGPPARATKRARMALSPSLSSAPPMAMRTPAAEPRNAVAMPQSTKRQDCFCPGRPPPPGAAGPSVLGPGLSLLDAERASIMSMRVLVVEDEADLADAVARGLRREGYAVDGRPERGDAT